MKKCSSYVNVYHDYFARSCCFLVLVMKTTKVTMVIILLLKVPEEIQDRKISRMFQTVEFFLLTIKFCYKMVYFPKPTAPNFFSCSSKINVLQRLNTFLFIYFLQILIVLVKRFFFASSRNTKV